MKDVKIILRSNVGLLQKKLEGLDAYLLYLLEMIATHNLIYSLLFNPIPHLVYHSTLQFFF